MCNMYNIIKYAFTINNTIIHIDNTTKLSFWKCIRIKNMLENNIL